MSRPGVRWSCVEVWRGWRRRSHRSFPVLFAIACWFGSVAHISAPTWSAVAILTIALLSRVRAVLLLAGFAAAAILAANARAGLEPLDAAAWSGRVELISDPTDLPGRVVADVATSQGRMLMTVPGSLGRVLRSSTAGSMFDVRGSVRSPSDPSRFESRHLRMMLSVTEIDPRSGRAWWRSPVDVVRSTVLRGADALPSAQRPVYSGFVIGDDRGSDPEVIRNFEDSGLSHLLVVSGENVVFVMAVASPLLSRLSGRWRLLCSLMILLMFAAVTRFEPSVLRATAMTAIAVLGVGAGRPVDAITRLSAAVSVLLLVDPLLVSSLGFRLSVAATAGIALFGASLARSIPGPTIFRQVLAVTIAAQIAVAPFVVPVFGPLPLVSLPANLLAEPVAGVVMMWGSSMGLLAGLVGGAPARILQLPASVGVSWIMGVARVCASLPLPRLDLLHILGAMLFCAFIGVFRRWWRTGHPARRADALAG